MFVLYTSFGGMYPRGNRVSIDRYTFANLDGVPYTLEGGTTTDPGLSGVKVWTWTPRGNDSAVSGKFAPFFLPDKAQQVNVYVH